MQSPIILWKDQTSYFMKIISALWRFYLLGLNSRGPSFSGGPLSRPRHVPSSFVVLVNKEIRHVTT